MTPLAPLLEAFFTERLRRQKGASPNTVAAYRDAFRLLLHFAQRRQGRAASNLTLSDLDAPLIGAFLDHLETERRNRARTRNARLAAIRSFFHFVAPREPAHAALIHRVLAIPQKRCDRRVVNFLTRPEVDAILASPDQTRWMGRRDHLLLVLAVETGLRVSELAHLRLCDVVLGAASYLRCYGKGRKERMTPLSRRTAARLRWWLHERKAAPTDPLFPARHGGALSRDAIERLLTKHTAAATAACPTLRTKPVSPHVLRHTTAVNLLQAGVDRAVIALILGHESVETTQMYLDADLATKERALARTAPVGAKHGRFRPSDSLLAFLQAL
ncbi:MAG: tyrosine-type recombinase/integrase [candidate division NC10 bacterium]|nr:tyrosine-type recombinase/integrase [candidate division NC10 bacterium]